MPSQEIVQDSTTTEVTVSAIKAILGDAFEYTDFEGNIHIQFAHLSKLTAISVCQGLLHATQQLQTAGYFPDPRLSWQTQENQWVSYPHIWITQASLCSDCKAEPL